MKCEEAKSLLTKYLLGDLEESQVSEVREHIERCADCSAEALEIQPTLDLLREALADTAPVPAKLEADKHVRIYTAEPKRMGKVIRIVAGDYPVLRRLAAGLVICCILGLLAGMLLPAVSFSKKRANIATARSMYGVSMIEPAQSVELEDIQEEIMPEPETVDSVEVRSYGGMVAGTVVPAPLDEYAVMPSVEDAGDVLEDAAVKQVVGAAASDPFAAPEPVGGFSPKPVEFDSVAIVKSPVIMKGIYGSRSPGARGQALARFGGGASADEPAPLSAPEDSLKRSDTLQTVWSDDHSGVPAKPKSDVAETVLPAEALRDEGSAQEGIEEREDLTIFRYAGSATAADSAPGWQAEKLEAPDTTLTIREKESGALASKGFMGRVPVIGRLFSGKESDAPATLDYLPATLPEEQKARSSEESTSSEKVLATKPMVPPAKSEIVFGAVAKRKIEAPSGKDALIDAERDKDDSGIDLKVVDGYEADKGVQIEDAPAAGTIYRKDGGQASGMIRFDESSSSYEIATGAVSVRVPEDSVERLVMKEAAAKPETKDEKQVEEKDNTTRFKAYGVNPVMNVSENAFSTFSIDVDTASYTLARNYIEGGYLPPAEAVRTEEVVNYFEYDYKAPLQRTFDVYAEVAPSKFGHGQHLLKIGVKGRRLGREEQRRAALTFLIDSSGSMETEDRIGLVKKSLKMLVDKLNDDDIVNIIQYDTRARLVLSGVKAKDRQKIKEAVDGLQCSGSTNLEDGIGKAYEAAANNFVSKGENRVLLLSDGVANLGAMDAEAILAKVEKYRKQGIYCSVFGVGMGTYDDQMLETLANKGDGMYRYLDSEEEAKRLFVDDLSATLNTIARDVKIQVEFNKQFVKTYRQLGYENRQLKKEQFRDDTVDAGEVGSGQSVTALYEIGMNPAGYKNAQKRLMAEPVATVRVRYRRVDNDAVEEIEIPVTFKDFVNDFDKADVRFRLAACAAEFAEILRGSPYAEGSSFEQVSRVLAPIKLELDLDQRVQEFYRLTTSATGMARGE